MEIEEALKVLKDHQKWRKGDDEIKATNPKKLSESIDFIIDFIETEKTKK